MIICIYGKSGAGKSTLARNLTKNLPNSIHIDMDILNRDLMKTPEVVADAETIFDGHNIMLDNKLNKKAILDCIIKDSELYTMWTAYMFGVCNKFLNDYIASTSFDYYIIDHINASRLNFGQNKVIYLECVADFDTRLARLKKRENIENQTLNFRDKKYQTYPSDMQYNSTNSDQILDYIKINK